MFSREPEAYQHYNILMQKNMYDKYNYLVPVVDYNPKFYMNDKYFNSFDKRMFPMIFEDQMKKRREDMQDLLQFWHEQFETYSSGP